MRKNSSDCRHIAFNKNKKKVVLIAGPSSSGKQLLPGLSIQLRVNGLKPVTISLDDYFVRTT